VGKGLKQLVAEDVRAISRLSHDFVKQAEIYGKIIINELNVPDEWYAPCAQSPSTRQDPLLPSSSKRLSCS